MTDNPLLGLHEKLGELTGKLGEMNHNLNNGLTKIDAIGEKVASTLVIVQRLELLEDRDRDKETRLAVLEADKHRREGAVGLVTWLSRHWPITIIVSAAVFIYGVITGKVQV